MTKREEIKKWLKDRSNLAFVALVLIAFAVRLYYFFHTSGQTLWWDEAEYMATAKHWALGVPYDLNPQRPPLFQLATALLLKVGFQEAALKFILVVLPSTFVIICIYLLGKELFSKRVALIAAFTSSFIWSLIFWTTRFQPDYWSLSFQLLSFLFIWKLFKQGKTSHAVYGGVFAALAFYFKISALLVPLSLFIFILFKDGFSFIKNKKYWITVLSFALALVPFSIWQYVMFGNPLAFAPSYIGGTGIGQGWELGWMALTFFYQFPKMLFFALFVIGAATYLFTFFLSADIMFKDKSKRLDANILSFIVLIVLALFYIFYIRGTIEDRWIFLIIPFVMYFAAQGLIYVYEKVAPHSKHIATIIVIVLIGVFVYYQLQHTTTLIDIKKSSYLPVKEASLWIKENSNPEDSFMSNSYTQATAYSERKVVPYPALKPSGPSSFVPLEKEEMDILIDENHPRYIMVSAFERHPDWTQEWIKDNEDRLIPVQIYFADPQQTQPLLIVYEIGYT